MRTLELVVSRNRRFKRIPSSDSVSIPTANPVNSGIRHVRSKGFLLPPHRFLLPKAFRPGGTSGVSRISVWHRNSDRCTVDPSLLRHDRTGDRRERESTILVYNHIMPRQKRNTVLRLSLAMVGLLIVGILGYSILEGWGFLESLYMVIITITTIGFGEVRSLSPAGRLFTILIIFMGLSIAAALFAQLDSLSWNPA
jgi:hypothetical protein